MSSKGRSILVVAGVAGALAVALLLKRGRPTRSSAVLEAPSASASAVPATSAPSPALPARALLPYVFDCAAFARVEPSACPGSPDAERQLLDLANSYRVSALPCSTTLADNFQNARTALLKVDQLELKKLAPLERALLQNAALELLSCTAKLTADEQALEVAKRARALVRKFALSAAESDALPSAASLVTTWLGDGAAWRRGLDSGSMHTRSEGFTRAHQQLAQADTLADVVRLVLVNQAGAPFVSDVVQRVVMRRKTEDAVHACIVELEPLPASCGPVALRPLDPERGTGVLAGSKQSASCRGCHVNNAARAKPYGSDTGFQVSDASLARIDSALQGLLR